jgi:hypothetical protein
MESSSSPELARPPQSIYHSESGKRVYTDPWVMMYVALSLSQNDMRRRHGQSGPRVHCCMLDDLCSSACMHCMVSASPSLHLDVHVRCTHAAHRFTALINVRTVQRRRSLRSDMLVSAHKGRSSIKTAAGDRVNLRGANDHARVFLPY